MVLHGVPMDRVGLAGLSMGEKLHLVGETISVPVLTSILACLVFDEHAEWMSARPTPSSPSESDGSENGPPSEAEGPDAKAEDPDGPQSEAEGSDALQAEAGDPDPQAEPVDCLGAEAALEAAVGAMTGSQPAGGDRLALGIGFATKHATEEAEHTSGEHTPRTSLAGTSRREVRREPVASFVAMPV